MSRKTAIFTKRPLPGRVKTRLSPPLSPQQGAELAEAMLDDLVERLRGPELCLVVDPPEEAAWFRGRYDVEVHIQEGEGLGERLARWFEESLLVHDQVVVVGSDLPALTRATVEEAHEHLAEGADVVFAPDLGGGYGLVGLSMPRPELFTGVTMSTERMLHDTLAVAVAAGLEPQVLAPVLDVDFRADLELLGRELDTAEGLISEADFPRRTHALLQTLLPLD